MKTYTIRDWTMIMISFTIAMMVSICFAHYGFSTTERTKSIFVLR
jgi:hypothetical protein